MKHMMNKISLGLVGLMSPIFSFAAGVGSTPWEVALNNLQQSITGPVLKSLGILSIVAFGFIFMTGDMQGVLGSKIVKVVVGLAIAFGATAVINWLGAAL